MKWAGQYWKDSNGIREVACRQCPQFHARSQQCGIGFGTPLRKCVVSSIEAHLHNGRKGEQALEIGYGRFSLGKMLLQRRGAVWTGIDPLQSKTSIARLGRGGYGHVAEIPFSDEVFDRVFGVQTLEHWGQKSDAAARSEPSDYADCIAEIHRVLKPAGSIYFDAPAHFHGHEMFIMGDVAAIRGLFDPEMWSEVTLERWRYHHAPLERYASAEKLYPEWEQEITAYDRADVDRAKHEPIWLLVITARKRA